MTKLMPITSDRSKGAVSLRLFFGALTLLAFPVWSQTNFSRPAPGRYLLIVETSRTMGHRSEGTLKTLANTLFTGMAGQIQQGDSIGVWTYNKDLYSGRLPLQRWSKLEQRDTCSTILNFIKGQKYENQPAFSSLRPALEKVVKDSGSITVILFSSGEEKILGTPFDDQINQLYDNWRQEQEKSRMPFVTVLRAKRGTIVGYSVTPTPWQVELPAWPAEPVVKAVEPPRPPPKVQPSTVPPLIVTGKKPKPVDTTDSTEIIPSTPANASNPALKVLPAAPAASTTSEASQIVTSQKALSNLPVETARLENKAEDRKETPRNPPEPIPSLTKKPVVAPTDRSQVAPSVTNNSSTSNTIAPAAVQESATPPQEISATVTTAGNGMLSNKIIWLAGLGILGLACGVLIAVNRRPRSQHISLISHSLGREKKG